MNITSLYHRANKNSNNVFRYLIMRLIQLSFNSDIAYNVNIHESVIFKHNARNVVISSMCQIGENSIIYHNVTIGAGPGGYPKIGKNVIIYTGAVVVGGIIVGDGAVITANSVVYTDVPENSVMQGNPAKLKRIQLPST